MREYLQWITSISILLGLVEFPAHAVMNGLGQDIFPQTAIFQSSATVLDARGLGSPSVSLAPGVVVSSETSAALGGGVRVSSNVYIVGFSSAAKYYGDGSALTGIAGGAAVLSGAVMFFNLAACPAGWTALAAAQGRYLVGLPSGGTLAAAVGTALSNTEDRPVGLHNHSITDPGHVHSLVSVGGSNYTNDKSGAATVQNDNYGSPLTGLVNSAVTGVTVNNSGTVAGTNAPYLQLLVCQKD